MTYQNDEWLDEILLPIIDDTDSFVVTTDWYQDAKAAIKAKLAEAVVAARKEQIMQDFAEASFRFDIDESDLTNWRLQMLSELTGQMEGEVGQA